MVVVVEQILPNFSGSMRQGREMARQDAAQNLLAQYMPGAMRGDENALNALAANPYTAQQAYGMMQDRQAQDYRQQTLDMDRERLDMARKQARAEAEAMKRAGRLAEVQAEAERTQAAFDGMSQALQAGDMQGFQAWAQRVKSPFQITPDNFTQVAPVVGASLEGYYEALKPKDEFRRATPEEARQYGAQAGQFGPDGRFHPINPPSGTSLTVNPETGEVSFGQGPGVTQRGQMPTDPGKLGFENSKSDAAALAAAREQAGAADSLAINTAEAERILTEGMRTGRGSGLAAAASGIGEAAGLSSGEYASDYEELDRISKAVGIDALRAMGGNDTERELLTAIQTTVSPTKQRESNLRTLAAQRAAVSTITEKPGLMEEWVRTYGSLANKDEDGNDWSSYWRQYQLGRFSELRDQYTAQYGVTDRTPERGGKGRGARPNRGQGKTEEPDFMNMSEAELKQWLESNGGY